MKKFIVHFQYLGFTFTSKVCVKKIAGKTVISTFVTSEEHIFLLDGSTIIFMQQQKGFELLLLKSDRSFELLDWTIQIEFLDNAEIATGEKFSLS